MNQHPQKWREHVRPLEPRPARPDADLENRRCIDCANLEPGLGCWSSSKTVYENPHLLPRRFWIGKKYRCNGGSEATANLIDWHICRLFRPITPHWLRNGSGLDEIDPQFNLLGRQPDKINRIDQVDSVKKNERKTLFAVEGVAV